MLCTSLNKGVETYKTKEMDHDRIEERTDYYSTDINGWETQKKIGCAAGKEL